MKKTYGVSIEGCVFANEGNLGHNEFLKAFIEFIESKGWHFGGGTCQIDDEDETVDDID